LALDKSGGDALVVPFARAAHAVFVTERCFGSRTPYLSGETALSALAVVADEVPAFVIAFTGDAADGGVTDQAARSTGVRRAVLTTAFDAEPGAAVGVGPARDTAVRRVAGEAFGSAGVQGAGLAVVDDTVGPFATAVGVAGTGGAEGGPQGAVGVHLVTRDAIGPAAQRLGG